MNFTVTFYQFNASLLNKCVNLTVMLDVADTLFNIFLQCNILGLIITPWCLNPINRFFPLFRNIMTQVILEYCLLVLVLM